MTERIAKAIRVMTIPTFLFLVLMLVTRLCIPEMYPTLTPFLTVFLLIGVMPFLGYIVSLIIRKARKQDREQGRKTQRLLAFIFSFIGYTAAFVVSMILDFTPAVRELTSTYFFTVAFLSIFNVVHIKASGHGAGIVGPMLLLCHYVGWIYIIPCLAVYAASFWCSVYLKRHTVIQFLLGTVCAAVAFVVSIFLF